MLSASFTVPSNGTVIEASLTRRADIVSRVIVRDASAWVARGEVLIKATGLFGNSKLPTKPVECVLHHAGDSAGVFRAGDQKPIGGSDDGAKRADLLGKTVAFKIGIEEREIPDSVKDFDFHIGRREASGSMKYRSVEGGGAQAAGSRQYFHR
jgi:hypothetical protein